MKSLLLNRSAAWLLAFCLIGSGCATVDRHQGRSNPDRLEEDEPPDVAGVWDPLEPINRYFHEFNMQADMYFLGPLAKAYEFVTPEFFRLMVSNFMNNLGEPLTAANQLLQGKPKRAASDVGRFAVNSTIGIGGLFDPATELNLPRHEEDFGQTLAVWGVRPGPYFVLPLFGPATLRELPSGPVEMWAKFELLEIFDGGNLLLPIEVVATVNERALEDPLERARLAIDPYIFIREAYFDRRRFLIYDGDPPIEAVEDWIIDLP